MNRSKAKGTAAESAVVEYLKNSGFPYASRHAPHGNLDVGDVNGVPGVVIEVKACRETALAEWLDEAATEAANANAPVYAVWSKRRRKSSPAEWYVILTGEVFVDLIR